MISTYTNNSLIFTSVVLIEAWTKTGH